MYNVLYITVSERSSAFYAMVPTYVLRPFIEAMLLYACLILSLKFFSSPHFHLSNRFITVRKFDTGVNQYKEQLYSALPFPP
jgi:hypothetical protein